MTKVWVVRADTGKYTDACVNGGFTGIGWEGVGDLATAQSKAELAARYETQKDLAESKWTISTNVSTIWRFKSEIQVGDWIITPALDRNELRYGQVTGECYYLPDPTDGCRYPHRRSVAWEAQALDRHSLSEQFQSTLGSAVTVFRVSHINEFLRHIGKPPVAVLPEPSNATASPKAAPSTLPAVVRQPFELALEEIYKLDPFDFEELVGHLLRAMGFEIEVTQKVGDGGVDFQGTLSVANAAQINITGQVKRYRPGSKIGPNPVRDLRGRIPIGGQGTFVTTSDYTANAREVAEEPGFPRVGLINGEQLVDLLTEHWRDIPDEFRTALALKPILVPA